MPTAPLDDTATLALQVALRVPLVSSVTRQLVCVLYVKLGQLVPKVLLSVQDVIQGSGVLKALPLA